MSQGIKKALELCCKSQLSLCHICPYAKASDDDCGAALMSDSLAYIETLEERLKEAVNNARSNQP